MPKRNTDVQREHIQSALRHVRSGQWSPQQAATMLMSEQIEQELVAREVIDRDAAGRLPDEPLDTLIDRLGTPPADVLRSWRFQLQVIARAFETERGNPFPQLEPANLTIDASGSLSCGEFRFDRSNAPDSPQMHRSQQNLDLLLHTLAGAHPTLPLTPEVLPSTVTVSGAEINSERSAATQMAAQDSLRSSQRKSPTHSILTRRRVTFAAITVCLAAAIAVMVYSDPSRYWGAPGDHGAAARPGGSLIADKELSADGPSTGGSRIDHSGLAADDVATELQTIDLLGDHPLANPEVADPLSLAELMPLRADFLSSDATLEPAQRRDVGDENTSAASAAAPDMGSGDADLAQQAGPLRAGNDIDNLPTESPQSTRLSTVTTIQLPAIHIDTFGNEEAAVNLWEAAIGDLQLDFPFDVPLAIEGHDTDWIVRDTRNDLQVAAIRTGDRGTQLLWNRAAADSPVAAALAHGRLRSGEERMVFLRPQIEANAWPLRLDQADVRPTWDLRGPLPPRVSRLSIKCDLPQDVEIGWIEPFAETDIRRGRAVAVLAPTDSENVAIGMRLDVRGGSKLSCRIRFAARLDPAMPWQVASASTLLQFADRLAEQAAELSHETQRLAAVYERADVWGRRVLRPKRERVAAQSDSLREMSSRVGELQSLISSLETHATLRLRVWVEWPDETQPIFEML